MPPVCPAGVTLSFSRAISGSQTVESGGSVSLGLNFLTRLPQYGQSVGWMVRLFGPVYL